MKRITALVLAAFASVASAQSRDWSSPQQPFTIYGNTHYVGTGGISAVLVTSPQGHILIDGATVEGGKVIADNIRTLGFKLEDIKYILNSHAHIDHAGGISGLQKLTGATVLAGAANVQALRTGIAPKEDPQFGALSNLPPTAKVQAVADGEVVKTGPLAIKAHSTPGHTPGGASWSWQSCEAGNCKIVVYGDSLSAVSADSYRFTVHPEVVASLERSIGAVEKLPCDVLITAHPEVNDLWGRQQRAAKEGGMAYVDPGACRALAANSRKNLAKRLASEAKK